MLHKGSKNTWSLHSTWVVELHENVVKRLRCRRFDDFLCLLFNRGNVVAHTARLVDGETERSAADRATETEETQKRVVADDGANVLEKRLGCFYGKLSGRLVKTKVRRFSSISRALVNTTHSGKLRRSKQKTLLFQLINKYHSLIDFAAVAAFSSRFHPTRTCATAVIDIIRRIEKIAACQFHRNDVSLARNGAIRANRLVRTCIKSAHKIKRMHGSALPATWFKKLACAVLPNSSSGLSRSSST